MPVTSLSALRPTLVLTAPVSIVGTPHMNSTTALIHRAPYMSQNSPDMQRVTTAPATEQIELVQICSLVRPRLDWTSARRGVMANHARKVKKNVIHA